MSGKVCWLEALFMVAVDSHTVATRKERDLVGSRAGLYNPPRLVLTSPPPPAMPPIPQVPFFNLRTVSPVDNHVENTSHQTIMETKVDISEALPYSILKDPSPSVPGVVSHPVRKLPQCSICSGIFEG